MPKFHSHNVTVIDTDSNAVIATIGVGLYPRQASFDSTNHRIYVTGQGSDSVFVIDTDTNTVSDTISVGDAPYGVAFDLVHDRMYVSNADAGTVSVISTATNHVIGDHIQVGDVPVGVAFDSENHRIYVANQGSADTSVQGSDTVSVIDTATNSVIDTISIGRHPRDVAFDSVNQRIYVVNAFSNTVSVIDTGTPPVITVTSPTSSSTIHDVTTSASAITWSLSKPIAWGHLLITRTGGTADSHSPHTCAFVGEALNPGDHDHFQLDDITHACANAVSLVSGAVYTFTFAGADAAGNAATPVSRTEVTFRSP